MDEIAMNYTRLRAQLEERRSQLEEASPRSVRLRRCLEDLNAAYLRYIIKAHETDMAERAALMREMPFFNKGYLDDDIAMATRFLSSANQAADDPYEMFLAPEVLQKKKKAEEKGTLVLNFYDEDPWGGLDPPTPPPQQPKSMTVQYKGKTRIIVPDDFYGDIKPGDPMGLIVLQRPAGLSDRRSRPPPSDDKEKC